MKSFLQNLISNQIWFLDHPDFSKHSYLKHELLGFSLKTVISHHFTHQLLQNKAWSTLQILSFCQQNKFVLVTEYKNFADRWTEFCWQNGKILVPHCLSRNFGSKTSLFRYPPPSFSLPCSMFSPSTGARTSRPRTTTVVPASRRCSAPSPPRGAIQ